MSDAMQGNTRSGLCRWLLSAAIVLSAHILIPVVLLHRSESNAFEAGSPVVMLELAPTPASPSTREQDLPPGPEQTQKASEERTTIEEQLPRQQKPEEPIPATSAAPNPAVTLPLPVKEMPKPIQQEKSEQTARLETPIATAPSSAAVPAPKAAGPLVGRTIGPASEVVASWQRQLLTQLQRFKRYPVQARGE